MTALKDFFGYIFSPYFFHSKEKLSVNILPILGKLLLAKFILVIIAYVIANQIFAVTDVHRPHRSSGPIDADSYRRLFIAIIAAPFLEELMFRSWLRKSWGIKYIFPITILLSFWGLVRFFGMTVPNPIIWLLFAGLFIYFIWVYRLTDPQSSIRFVNAVFPIAFWMSTLAFALLHLTNFKVEQIGVLGVLIVLPQFISGAFYGYIVKRYGFWAAVGSHAFWNGTLIFISIGLRAI